MKNSCSGFCVRCQTNHSLPIGRAREHALGIIEQFKVEQRLDYTSPPEKADPRLSFENLLPGDRGHMFGVMECENPSGETVWLQAFSSLGTGVRDVEGWVPYLVDTPTFERVVLPVQREIKRLTAERNALPIGDPRRNEIEKTRRRLSRDLMPKVHDLYFFQNFRGERRPLRDIFISPNAKGIPGGVGDCCAPKLINHAIDKGLKPISIAEFYWGGENKSGRKKPGQFFEACADKCQPILGFMLCGLESESVSPS